MTPDPQEGVQAPEELQEQTVPEVSEVLEVQQPSAAPAGLTEARFTELLDVQKAALLEEFDRKLQSQKDRRIGKLESKVEELLATKEAVESAGGWDQIIDRQQQAEDLETRFNTILDARLSQAPAPQRGWQAEWDAESQKILDGASKLGVSLTTEEYNAALFGKKFATKGDAFAALSQALLRKGRGESIPTAAVIAEGGEVARLPEPKAPKNFRQKFDEARAKGDGSDARKLLDERWAEVDKLAKVERARRVLAQEGVAPEDLT